MKKISIRRTTLLMGRYMALNFKHYAVLFGAMSGVLVGISLLKTWSNGGTYDTYSSLGMGQLFIFLMGLIITSTIFKELGTKSRGWFYMMLPANPMEKLLANWLISTVVYSVVASVVLVLTSMVNSLFTSLIFNEYFYIVNPFRMEFLKLLLHYCIIQSIFFLGAIYFEKNNFFKTLLAIVVSSMGLMIITGIVVKLIFQSPEITIDPMEQNGTPEFLKSFVLAVKIGYYSLIVPFFLTVSYFRLKEREV